MHGGYRIRFLGWVEAGFVPGSKAADDTFASIPHYGRDLESLLSVYFDQLADKVLPQFTH